jgi:PilZ domain-containing protein
MILETISSVEQPLEAKPIDRRHWARYACSLQGQCHPITAMEASNTWPAQTVDISAGGVGLRLCRRFEPGTLLSVDLGNSDDDATTMPLARVRYVVPVGAYSLLGCAWAEKLETNDLRRLLAAQHTWQPAQAMVRELVGS